LLVYLGIENVNVQIDNQTKFTFTQMSLCGIAVDIESRQVVTVASRFHNHAISGLPVIPGGKYKRGKDRMD